MSILIESLKRLYEKGRVTKEQLKVRVEKGTITAEEYWYITGENYEEGGNA